MHSNGNTISLHGIIYCAKAKLMQKRKRYCVGWVSTSFVWLYLEIRIWIGILPGYVLYPYPESGLVLLSIIIHIWWFISGLLTDLYRYLMFHLCFFFGYASFFSFHSSFGDHLVFSCPLAMQINGIPIFLM